MVRLSRTYSPQHKLCVLHRRRRSRLDIRQRRAHEKCSYFAGAATLVLSLTAFWLRSPEGARAARGLLGIPPESSFGPMELGYAYLVGFPLAFLLLGASAGHWRLGVAWYLGAGIVFLGLNALTGLLTSQLPAGWFVWMAVAWPHYVLVMLGAFEWTFG